MAARGRTCVDRTGANGQTDASGDKPGLRRGPYYQMDTCAGTLRLVTHAMISTRKRSREVSASRGAIERGPSAILRRLPPDAIYTLST